MTDRLTSNNIDVEKTIYWIIKFEDVDKDDILLIERDGIVTKEDILSLYNDLLIDWNCHLFKQVRSNGKPIGESK